MHLNEKLVYPQFQSVSDMFWDFHNRPDIFRISCICASFVLCTGIVFGAFFRGERIFAQSELPALPPLSSFSKTSSQTVGSSQESVPAFGSESLAKKNSSGKKRRTFKVFYPRDENSEFVYISLEMLNDLKTIAQLENSEQNRWFITSSKYRGYFTSNAHPLTPGVSISNLRAVYEVELESENATLVFPGLPLVPESAKWDGQPLRLHYIPEREEDFYRSEVPPGSTGFPKDRDLSGDSVSRNPGTAVPGREFFPEEPQSSFAANSGIPGEGFPEKSRPPAQLVFSVEHQKKGKHVLELLLAPNVEQVDENRRRISISPLPRVANSILELNTSPDAPEITVEKTLGSVSPEPGKLVAKLGAVDEITFSWSDDGNQFGQTVVECDQLFILSASAQPNQIRITAQYKFRIFGGKVQQLEIAADPRMQLVGTPICENNPEAVLEPIVPGSGSEGITRLVFREPISGYLTVRANYYIRDFSGIGVIRFPKPVVSRSKIGKSWMGIWSAAALELSSLQPSSISGDRFKQEWGGDFEEPLLAVYDLKTVDPSWTLSTRMKELVREGTVRQSVLYRFNRRELFYDATVDCNGPLFMYSFRVPIHTGIEGISVQHINTVNEEKTPVPIRWIFRPIAEKDEGTANPVPEISCKILTLFSERSLAGKHEISIRARIPSEEGSPVQFLPLLEINGVDIHENQVDVYRDVSVVLRDGKIPPSWNPLEKNAQRGAEWSQSSLIGSWSVLKTGKPESNTPDPEPSPGSRGESSQVYEKSDGTYEWAQFSVYPNNPKISGRQISIIDRNINSERFEILEYFDLEIQEGELNSFRMRFDEHCTFPPAITPAMRAEEVREEGIRSLVLFPSQPLSGKVQFSIRSHLNTSMESTYLPRNIPNVPSSLKHYIVLPAEIQLKAVEWEKKLLGNLEGKESEEILKEIQQRTAPRFGEGADTSLPSSVSRFELFLVNGPDYSARINPKGNRPIVHLNDISLYLRKNGMVSGVSTFNLRGEGADHCILQIPEQCELVSISSGGITSRGTPLSQGRWKVDIWTTPLPQRIAVVFQGKIACSPLNSASNSNPLPEGTSSSRSASRGEEAILPLYYSEEIQRMSIPLPLLESTSVLGTIWTVAFESPDDSRPLRFFVENRTLLRDETEDAENSEISPDSDHDFRNPADSFSRAEDLESLLEKQAVIPLSFRSAIPGLIQMNLVRLSNMEAMMNGFQHSLPGIASPELDRWYSQWGRRWWLVKKEVDSLLIFRENRPQRNWKNVLFCPGGTLQDSLGGVLNSIQSPDRILQARVNERIVPPELLEKDKELSRGDFTESNIFSALRMSQSEDSSYLFGAAGENVLSLEVFSVPQPPGLLENAMVRWSLFCIGTLGAVIFIRSIHPRRLFRQFPFFIGHVIAVVLWLILSPGFIGLALIPLIWLSMIWPSWRRRFRTME